MRMKRKDYDILLLRKELEKRIISRQLENNAIPENKRARLKKRLEKIEEEIPRHRIVIKIIKEKRPEKKE
jgi:hypothetical protein